AFREQARQARRESKAWKLAGPFVDVWFCDWVTPLREEGKSRVALPTAENDEEVPASQANSRAGDVPGGGEKTAAAPRRCGRPRRDEDPKVKERYAGIVAPGARPSRREPSPQF